MTNYEPSGVWYCRKHFGTVNEDESRDECPWYDGTYDEDGNPNDPCDWTELFYEVVR